MLHSNAESGLWCCRYENALQKANYASLAMKQEQEQEQADAEDEDELQVGVLFDITFLAADLRQCTSAGSMHAGKPWRSPAS